MELLVIKPSSIGDIVHGLQIVQAIVDRNPGIRVTWVVRDRFAPLVEAAPFVQRVLLFRRRAGWGAFWKLLKEIRSTPFDCVLDLQGLLRSGLMTAAARAPEKWGRPDDREGAFLFYRSRVARPPGTGPHHAIEILLPFAARFGVTTLDRTPLRLNAAGSLECGDFFASGERPPFLMFPQSRGAGKEWPYFGRLLELIFKTIPDAKVIWCTETKTDPGVPVPEGRFRKVTGKTFGEIVSLVSRRGILIGNDSGPMHLAAAVGNPVLAVFGPTAPRRFGPWPLSDPKHRVIIAPGGRLTDLAPEQVLSELQDWLQNLNDAGTFGPRDRASD